MVKSPSQVANQEKIAAARAGFNERGESIAEWSRARGCHPYAVYQVLSGRTRAHRGISHAIAVALGIKPAPPCGTQKEANIM